jgi:phage shock protein A
MGLTIDIALAVWLLMLSAALVFVWYRARKGRRVSGRQIQELFGSVEDLHTSANELLAGINRLERRIEGLEAGQQALDVQMRIEHLHHLTSTVEARGRISSRAADRLRRRILDLRAAATAPSETSPDT